MAFPNCCNFPFLFFCFPAAEVLFLLGYSLGVGGGWHGWPAGEEVVGAAGRGLGGRRQAAGGVESWPSLAASSAHAAS